jgi:hypothetical protein
VTASQGDGAVADQIDVIELARELAEIARTTTDAKTGERLIELINRLLREAGLPGSPASDNH